MDIKTICAQQLTHLSTAVIKGRKAPHKALLLLAIMDLVDKRIITSPRIVLNDELEDAFEKEWHRFIGTSLVFKCTIATPFWHMKNEPFYRLFLNSGEDIRSVSNPYSKKRLREDTFAIIDSDLFSLMQIKEYREEFKEILTKTYLIGLRSDLSV